MTQDRYMRPGLDFAVGKAVEEMGELQAALGKTLRWGWDSVNPELPLEKQETNRNWVLREIGDVEGALENLRKELGYAKPTPPTWESYNSMAGELGSTHKELADLRKLIVNLAFRAGLKVD